jgi:hypothetical protein
MASKSTLYVVAAAALLSFVATALSMSGFLDTDNSKPIPTVTEALNMPAPLLTQLILYPGARDRDRGMPFSDWQSTVVVLRKDGHGVQARYNKGADRSSEDVFFQVDGAHIDYSQSYYPVLPGEEANGRHRHVERLYSAGTGALHDEDVRRVNGRRQEHTHIDHDGSEQVIDYDDYNGVDVIVGQQLFDPKAVLQREERWRPDNDHSLSYSDILNSDGTRIATDWDEEHVPLKIAHWPANGSAVDATVVGYFAKSHKLRLESKTDSSIDSINYYRETGTLACTISMGLYSADITYYDNAGKNPRLKQWWWVKDESVNGVKQRVYYSLYSVGEMDGQGNLTREVNFNEKGIVTGLTSYDEDVNGAHYKMIYRSFRPIDGTLDIVTYWPTGLQGNMEKREDHTAEENIRIPVTVPADELNRQVEIDPNLPIPPPSYSH